MIVPPEFRLSQREANSATRSSFTILAKYDLENQFLIDFLELSRCKHIIGKVMLGAFLIQ